MLQLSCGVGRRREILRAVRTGRRDPIVRCRREPSAVEHEHGGAYPEGQGRWKEAAGRRERNPQCEEGQEPWELIHSRYVFHRRLHLATMLFELLLRRVLRRELGVRSSWGKFILLFSFRSPLVTSHLRQSSIRLCIQRGALPACSVCCPLCGQLRCQQRWLAAYDPALQSAVEPGADPSFPEAIS